MPKQSRLTHLWHQFASPHYVENIARIAAPWCYCLAFALLLVGFVWGLFTAPADYQQKDAFRIIYLHVPAAMLSMGIYVSMAVAAVVFFFWYLKVAAYYCRAVAGLDAVFTALVIFTSAVWAKPMWNTFWSWGDPRLVLELVLLFLYMGYMAWVSAAPQRHHGDSIGAILLIVGVVNIPIIHYSVITRKSYESRH